ncbi:MAG: hypothetical protein DRP64_00005, partial [Verrucomicrobia bacterium]
MSNYDKNTRFVVGGLLTVLFFLFSLIVLGIVASSEASAATADGLEPRMIINWSPVTEQEDGTIIPSSDIGYRVYSTEGVILCSTGSTECEVAMGYSQCMSVYATALQTSTMLESQPSNVVEGCTDPKPAVPLRAPVIGGRIETG